MLLNRCHTVAYEHLTNFYKKRGLFYNKVLAQFSTSMLVYLYNWGFSSFHSFSGSMVACVCSLWFDHWSVDWSKLDLWFLTCALATILLFLKVSSSRTLHSTCGPSSTRVILIEHYTCSFSYFNLEILENFSLLTASSLKAHYHGLLWSHNTLPLVKKLENQGTVLWCGACRVINKPTWRMGHARALPDSARAAKVT